MDCLSGVSVAISDELVSSITQVVNLFLDEKCPKMLGEYIASAPLTPLVKLGCGIRPIVVGTIWRRLVSKVSVVMIGHSLDGYLNDLQFGVRVPGGGEAILHVVNLLHPLVSKIRDTFNLYLQAWYLDDGTIIGDTLVVGEVLKVIMNDGPRRGLHLNVDKTEVFWPKEDPRGRFAGVFTPNIACPLHGVKLLGGPASENIDFSSELVMKRVARYIVLLDTVFEQAQRSLDAALRSSLECIITASGPGSSDRQWRLSTFPFAFRGLGVCSACDVLNYSFLASRLQSVACNLSCFEILILYIYITHVTQTAESTFSLSTRQMALWKSQMEEHTSEWLRVVSISGLGQTMNGGTYRCVLCYRLGVPLFTVPRPCSACSKVFVGDIYEDHAVS
ncbi:hypothetical protein Tco_0248016 [Tanacetum coccineum]